MTPLPESARRLIESGRLAHCVTLNADGSPQVSAVWIGLDGDEIVMAHLGDHLKVRNLRRDPRAWLCVLPDGFFGRWISVEGAVDILGLPEAMEPLVDYYRSAVGEHPDWADYRAAMERERRVLIRIDPARAGPDRSG